MREPNICRYIERGLDLSRYINLLPYLAESWNLPTSISSHARASWCLGKSNLAKLGGTNYPN